VTRLLSLLDNLEDNDEGPAFHVVAPSLPNFGFSSAVKKRGFGLKQYAETCHKLMLALGYGQYVSQGGDWVRKSFWASHSATNSTFQGSSITRVMGELYGSKYLKASHLNLVASLPPTLASPFAFIGFLARHILKLYTPAEKAGLERTQQIQKTEMGYYSLQSTKPQTIGYSLADSPVGLLAWIYEKLHYWTDDYDWQPEEVCTWVSMYWFSSAGPAASVRIYHESQRGEFTAKAGGYVPGVKLVRSALSFCICVLGRSLQSARGWLISQRKSFGSQRRGLPRWAQSYTRMKTSEVGTLLHGRTRRA
jgi:pimeloyl-ACP methyl ester carboxylesterase